MCLCAWGWCVKQGRDDWVASTLNMGAFLVGLHFALSWLMAERAPDGSLTATPITIFSFGVIIILAFFAGTAFMLKQTRLLKIEDKRIFDWAFWMLVVGIIGSRLLYAYLNHEHFRENKAEIFKIWHGGLVWYGGLIPAALVGVWLLRRHKLPTLHVCDLGAAAVILALGIGRWACLLAGDDYGRPTEAWFGIRFYHEQCLVPRRITRPVAAPDADVHEPHVPLDLFPGRMGAPPRALRRPGAGRDVDRVRRRARRPDRAVPRRLRRAQPGLRQAPRACVDRRQAGGGHPPSS